MFFQYPAILLLLWILPVVAWLLVRAERKRSVAARRFVQQPMVSRLMPRLGGPRPWIKGTLVVLSLGLLIVAAARPRFGVYFEKVVRRGVDCFVLLDVSRSMLAEDVAPNRLERAKLDIRDLLNKLVGDRVGLIVFAGKPVLKAPLTTDEGFFRGVLDDVSERSAPRGGTLIGDAIRKALEAMPPQADHDQVLVIFTDGEDQDSYPIEAAEQAAERGVKIFTIGLGDSAEGARIPLHDASGNLVYLKDDGKEHWSKTNHKTLVEISDATKGAHVPAGTKYMGRVFEDHLADLTRSEDVQDQKRKRHRDRYQIFLMLAVVLFAAEMLIPAHARASRNCGTAAPHPKVATKCLLAALLLLPAQALASVPEAAREVDKGLAAFRGGDFKAAAEAFSAADRALPDQPRIAFDLGCAYAAEGKHVEATEQFRAAALSPDVKLAATAHYNLGCLELSKAKTIFGESPEEAASEVREEGIAMLVQAAGNFRDALAVDPQLTDPRYNLEAVRLWIKHIKEVWRQRDRDKLRKEMNLLQFLGMLEGRQRELRTSGRTLAETPPSPLRREEIRTIEKEQRYLAEEIEPLKQKVAAALGTAPQPGGAAPPNVGADSQKALSLLNNLADEVHGAMRKAADSLAAGNPPDAVATQSASVEKLDQVFMAVAPFVNLVQKAVKTQQGLIDRSKGAISAEMESEESEKSEKGEAVWNQRFISSYGRILPAKAQRELEQLEKAPAAQPAMPDPQNGKAEDAAKAAEKQKKQQEEMKRALKAGVELAPKVEELSVQAVAALSAAKPAEALPLQEEALKLLKEMLPKQEQQKNKQDKKDEQNKQDQQNKDQNKQDKKDKDKQKKDEQNKDKEKDKQKKDQQNKDQQKKDQQKKDREKDKTQAQKQQKEKLSKQEAKAVMRKARERRQQRKELEKALQERLYRHEKVDKDW